MRHNKNQIISFIKCISNILLINGGFLDSPGLYTGEMGLVLFFFRYAYFSKNELYKEYGFVLIEKIQNKIYQETPIDYKQGLTGIGSAIEYLVQKGYIDANTDEILEDFDARIFSIQDLPHTPIETMTSIGYYANWRMSGNSRKKDIIRQTILSQVERILHNHSIIPTRHLLYDKNHQDGVRTKTYCHFLELITNNDPFDINRLDLGFENGLAGLGMTLLSELDGDISWTSLFPNYFNSTQNESIPL